MNLFYLLEANVLFFSTLFFIFGLVFSSFQLPLRFYLSLIFILIINWVALALALPEAYEMGYQMLFSDGNTSALRLALLSIFMFYQVFVFLGVTPEQMPGPYGIERLFFQLIILFAALTMASAQSTLLIVVLMELVGFVSFVLVVFQRSRYSLEAAYRYLIFSSVATGFFIVALLLGDSSVPFYQFDQAWFVVNNLLIDLDNFFGHRTGLSLFSFFLVISFLMKFGLGPFSQWFVDVYTAANFQDFVFLSVFAKLPLVLAFSKLYVTGAGESVKYLFIFFIIIFAFHSAVALLRQRTVRRFFAYSSLFNYALVFLVFFSTSGNHTLMVLYLFYYSLIGLLLYAAYDWFKPVWVYENPYLSQLADHRTEQQTALLAFAFILNSGLPPLGIFLMKMTMLGSLPHMPVGFSFGFYFFFFLVFVLLVFSTLNLFAYFRALSFVFNFKKDRARTVQLVDLGHYHMVAFFTGGSLALLPLHYLWLYGYLKGLLTDLAVPGVFLVYRCPSLF